MATEGHLAPRSSRMMKAALVLGPVAPTFPRLEPPTSEPRPGFAELDDALVAAVPSVLVVVCNDERDPLMHHAARRLRATGCDVVLVLRRTTLSVFREAATQLGLGKLDIRPAAYAAALSGTSRQRLAIVAPLPPPGSWDDAVAREIEALGNTILVFMTTSTSSHAWPATFDTTSRLTNDDKLRWLAAAVGESAPALHDRDLLDLESWWRRTRPTIESGFEPPGGSDGSRMQERLSPRALDVATRIALARRAVPLATFAPEDVDDDVLRELRAARVLTNDDVVLLLDPSVDPEALEAEASPEARARTAHTLLEARAFEGDPWASARAAELLLAHEPALANEAMGEALRLASGSRLITELDDAWFAAVTGAGVRNTELLRRSAERVLAVNKPKNAKRWLDAMAAGGLEPWARLLAAKAEAQSGDFIRAAIILESIGSADIDDDLRAEIAVERGELALGTGDYDAANAHAGAASTLTNSLGTQLAARSVLGKVLLARGAWDAADVHFAADALLARSGGERKAELRSRLNRGIALLSKGLLDEARQVFAEVRDDAERYGEPRAIAFALSNLGVAAYRQRDYAAALRCWETTIKHADALGGPNVVTQSLLNLAGVQLRLGLLDQAESTIAYGQRTWASSLTPLQAAQFRLITAQVASARGSNEPALAELQSALVHARASGDADMIAATATAGARAALADGDVRGAKEWLELSGDGVRSARWIAESAVLRAMICRASGEPALATASRALALVRQAGEDDLLIDVHTLIATCARESGDLEAARESCSRALTIRDRVAARLPLELREGFLSKHELRYLEHVWESLSFKGPEAAHAGASTGNDDPRPKAELVGTDWRMKNLLRSMQKAAVSDSTILIRGESGTGKELVARELHAMSGRAAGPLVIVNCAALVETLLLSELFGHEKGAFTGAASRRRGRFELADGGTLFLDEIGDISPRMQVALLRVLQEKTFERIGGTTTLRTNVRVICATHRDLYAMVKGGSFREDLYYRIRGITLEVPPLRARSSDIPSLVTHLLRRIAREQQRAPKLLAPDALELLVRHRWPGNVRELENVLRASYTFAEGETIGLADLVDLDAGLEQSSESTPSVGSGANGASLTEVAYAHVREGRVSLHDVKRQIERECVTRALRESNGNITRAAEMLGMKRPRVSQIAKQYRLSASLADSES